VGKPTLPTIEQLGGGSNGSGGGRGRRRGGRSGGGSSSSSSSSSRSSDSDRESDDSGAASSVASSRRQRGGTGVSQKKHRGGGGGGGGGTARRRSDAAAVVRTIGNPLAADGGGGGGGGGSGAGGADVDADADAGGSDSEAVEEEREGLRVAGLATVTHYHAARRDGRDWECPICRRVFEGRRWVEYAVLVRYNAARSWVVVHRFSHFVDLRWALGEELSASVKLPPLPPKEALPGKLKGAAGKAGAKVGGKLLLKAAGGHGGSNTGEFLDERLSGLQRFLAQLLLIPHVLELSDALLDFIDEPDDDWAAVMVQTAFRGLTARRERATRREQERAAAEAEAKARAGGGSAADGRRGGGLNDSGGDDDDEDDGGGGGDDDESGSGGGVGGGAAVAAAQKRDASPGLLTVEVVRARGLTAAGKRMADPYATVRCEGRIAHTRVVRRSLEPAWRQALRFERVFNPAAALLVAVTDDEAADDELLGLGELALAAVGEGAPGHEEWVALRDRAGHARGEVLLRVFWHIDAPMRAALATAEAQRRLDSDSESTDDSGASDGGAGAGGGAGADQAKKQQQQQQQQQQQRRRRRGGLGSSSSSNSSDGSGLDGSGGEGSDWSVYDDGGYGAAAGFESDSETETSSSSEDGAGQGQHGADGEAGGGGSGGGGAQGADYEAAMRCRFWDLLADAAYARELRAFVKELARGIEIVKHGRRGAPKERVLFSGDGGATLSWAPRGQTRNVADPSGEKSFALADVCEIRCGVKTRALRRGVPDVRWNLAFALMLPVAVAKARKDKRKSFGVEAADNAQYRTLMVGFKLLKAQQRFGDPPSGWAKKREKERRAQEPSASEEEVFDGEEEGGEGGGAAAKKKKKAKSSSEDDSSDEDDSDEDDSDEDDSDGDDSDDDSISSD
jgi:hypothetical protein